MLQNTKLPYHPNWKAMELAYRKQVALLLAVLPEVAKENCLALHGGTAINLFVRDMPRLSVDIDLTYVPIEDRATSFANITKALGRIKSNIGIAVPNARVSHREDVHKLQISQQGADVKLEVNPVGRGTLSGPTKMQLCEKAQEAFGAFAAIQTVPFGQLYGGKTCAALDRQHPRDLFDVKYLLENEGFSEGVKKGFLLCLLGSERPAHELLWPILKDQRSALSNQFEGMSDEPFGYGGFEEVRERLVLTVQNGLTEKDMAFLLGVYNLEPDWGIHDFRHFPSVKWKIQNLEKLKRGNPSKHKEQYDALKKAFGA